MMRMKPAFTLALGSFIISVSLYAAPETSGVVELPAMTMAEMGKEPVPFLSAHLARDHERHEREAEVPTPYAFSYRPEAAATAAIPAPSIDTAFRDANDSPRAFPADASAAVGPHHLVAATNVYVTVHDRTGKSLSSVYVEQFWSDTIGFLFDPRVSYDETRDRWVVAMLIDQNLVNAYLLVAVSSSGDPLGSWRRFKIPAMTTNNQLADLDFTRLAVTGDNVLLAAELYQSNQLTGTEVFVINAFDAFDSPNPITVSRMTVTDKVTPVSTTQPSNFFVSPYTGGFVLWRLNGSSSLAYVGKSAQLGAYPTSLIGRQLGSNVTFGLFFEFIQSAVMNDGFHIWTAQDFGGTVTITKGDTSGGVSTITLADPAGKAAYAFPSLAVTRDGSALVAYAVFDAGAYISSQCVFIDRAGNVSTPVTIKNGELPYAMSRWGDYTTTVVDPVDHTSFWTLQIYPMQLPNPTFTISVWATWWAHVSNVGKRVHAVRH